MGFNAKQPGKIKKADVAYLAAGIIVIVAMIIYAIR